MVRGDFWKSPLELPQNSPTKRIATHGRKCEQRASFFYAFKGSFRAPLLQYRLQFLPLSLVDFFEASPYGVLADGGEGVKEHSARRLCDVREHFAAPPPGGAGGGRVALLARRNARNSPPAVFFLPSFFFWAYMGKRKSGGRSVETQYGYCLRAEVTLGSLREGAGERMRD